MKSSDIVFAPIGVIRSEHTIAKDTPAQYVFAHDCTGTVEVLPEYAEGLADIEDYSHIYLLYHLHRASCKSLTVNPFLQDTEHGIFATRAPFRPNGIGLSIVELTARKGCTLYIRGVDILDGTPLIDIKPYSAKFDHVVATRSGWLDDVDDDTAHARGRRGYSAKV